ncbi:MAG: acyl-CoA reductase [Saccharofermentans sp.]|nr:acyl-CoA reductase [Saccharofermentans sp.]
MILYRGDVYDNSSQDELLDKLPSDLYSPINEGRRLEISTVIDACDSLARRVLTGDFKEITDPFMAEFNISEEQFADMAKMFTREKLEYKCSIELTDDKKVIDGSFTRERYPLGVLLHIAAGNVDVLPAYSVVEGLLAGNINILKLPMGDSGLSVKLLNELIKVSPEISDYVYVFDVPSTDTENIKHLADLSDAIVVWGGDMAVRAARTMADTNTKIISWGHKLSFAYVYPDCTDDELRLLAESICVTNQLLCSSCQGIFVATDRKEEQKALAVRFFSKLKEANSKLGAVSYGMRAKNAITIYNERLESDTTGHEILSEDGVSVILSDDSSLELSYLYRNVWVKKLPYEKIGELKQYKDYLQTAAVLTSDKETFARTARRLGDVGVVRITSAGKMSRMNSGEAHDGMYALRAYSRIVETEILN